MALFGLIALVLLGLAIYAPQLWVKRQMARHGEVRADFPGTGAQLAEHLIERFEIPDVTVERTEMGDHYDPDARVVRLSQANHDTKSLTAVAVAAHEVGHALQHARGESGLRLRQWLVTIAAKTDMVASVFFVAAPLLAIFARTPAAFFGFAAIGIGLLSIRIIVHLVTLPVEYDASFRKALPILREGGFLSNDDLGGARQVLKAAAYTYVAGALVSLLDLARWARILIR